MHILITSPVSSGELYPEAVKSFGGRVTVVTTNRGPYLLPAHVLPHIDEFIVVAECDEATIRRAALRVHAQRPLTGIVAGDEFVVPATAHIAAELGLPGLSPSNAQAARDKGTMRKRLAAAGVPNPQFRTVDSAESAAAAGYEIGFPLVVKPIDMVGSIGVRRADTPAELNAAYQFLRSENDPRSQEPLGARAVVESYVQGQEYSIEGYLDNGVPVIAAITTKHLSAEPTFQELGHFVRRPADVPEYGEIDSYLSQVVTALGISIGAFHAELRMTEDGPRLMEIGARLGGEHIPELMQLSTGVSLAKASLASLTSTEIPKPEEPVANVAGIHYVPTPDHLLGGTYRSIRGWDEAAAAKNVVSATIEIPPGAPIPASIDLRSRLAYLIFTTDTYEEAWEMRRWLDEIIHVV